MNAKELTELYTAFTRSVFRLETLAHYRAPDDGPRLAAWRRGEPLPMRPGKTAWLEQVRAMRAAGKQVTRVHIVDFPLSQYTRYELDVYAENTAAGENVRILDRAVDPKLDAYRRDFLLFDEQHLVWFDYDADGRRTAWRRETDQQVIFSAALVSRSLLAMAIPLADFHPLGPTTLS